MRVGIFLGHLSMGGPARVADAGCAAYRIPADRLAKVINPADLLSDGDASFLDGGDPGGIVATVFKALQPLQKDGHRLRSTDISYDSTHKELITECQPGVMAWWFYRGLI